MKAEDYSHWIEKHYTEIEVCDNPFNPEIEFRLVRPGDILTLDLHLNRLNVYIDENGIVEKIEVG